MAYKLTQDPKIVIRVEDGACIPVDLFNSDYIMFLEFKAKGGVAGVADPAPVLQKVVSASDLAQVLITKGTITAADVTKIGVIIKAIQSGQLGSP